MKMMNKQYCILPFKSRDEFDQFTESEGLDLEKISSMTCEELQRMAQKFLDNKNIRRIKGTGS